MARLRDLPDGRAIERLYDEGYFRGGDGAGGYPDYARDEELHRRNARRRLSLLEDHLPAGPGSLVDVGCAMGFFLDEAREAGWTVAGVEVSEYAAARARRNLQLDVRASLTEIVGSHCGELDLVTFFQVLEHMRDPARVIGTARRLLDPGGLLAIETWDRESTVARVLGRFWHQVTPPNVTHLFGRSSIERLLNGCGYDVVWVGTTPKEVRLNHVARLLDQKLPLLGTTVSRLLTATRLHRRGLLYRLGDLITVLARPA